MPPASLNDFAGDNLFDLTGRVALVTGGGTGIGLITAKAFASNGAKVYITGRRLEVLQEAAKLQFRGQGKIEALQMDVTKKESIQVVVETIAKNDGKLHVLVNNAGGVGPVTPFSLDPTAPQCTSAAAYGQALFDSQQFQEWESITTLNTASIFFVTTAFLGLLEKGAKDLGPEKTASVINISSAVTNMKTSHSVFSYVTTKSAATRLTTVLAADLALKGFPIRVNAIAPGFFPSELRGTEEFLNEFAKGPGSTLRPSPLLRPGREPEMASVVLYLASPTSSFTNGQEIVVDGGLWLVNP